MEVNYVQEGEEATQGSLLSTLDHVEPIALSTGSGDAGADALRAALEFIKDYWHRQFLPVGEVLWPRLIDVDGDVVWSMLGIQRHCEMAVSMRLPRR